MDLTPKFQEYKVPGNNLPYVTAKTVPAGLSPDSQRYTHKDDGLHITKIILQYVLGIENLWT